MRFHTQAAKEVARFFANRRAELAEEIPEESLIPVETETKRPGLTATQRKSRYRRFGRSELTAAQERRIRHKSGHRKAQARRRRRGR